MRPAARQAPGDGIMLVLIVRLGTLDASRGGLVDSCARRERISPRRDEEHEWVTAKGNEPP